MNIFDRVLDDLIIKYNRGSIEEIIKPFEYHGYSEPQNILFKVEKGTCYVGQDHIPLKEGHYYFIPNSELIYLRTGIAKKYAVIGEEGFPGLTERNRFHTTVNAETDLTKAKDILKVIFFDVDIHDAFGFFSIMELPCMILPPSEVMDFLIDNIILEAGQSNIGRDRLIDNYIYEIVIFICRHINSQERFITNVEKLQLTADNRLLDMLTYIKINLSGDLTNEILCDVACLAKEYIGQFFKRSTGKNLQQYIENQRLAKAHELLLTGTHSVQEVTFMVGFKDAAYFSKRFKAKYGDNPIHVKHAKANITYFSI